MWSGRRVLTDLLASDAMIYGVNTGFGKLANQRIEPHEILALQENLLRSHAVGMGPLLSVGTTRLAPALRHLAPATGHSRRTRETPWRFIRMFRPGAGPPHPAQASD